MTSGIPDYLSQDNFIADYTDNPNKNWLPEEIVDYVAKKPLLFPPGTAWNYSNTNYILAGMIIAKLTGHTVEEEMNRRFFSLYNSSHLDLKNTHYITNHYPIPIAPSMTHGYMYKLHISGKFFPPKTDMTYFSLSYGGAAGAIVSNTEDITQWVRALLTPNKVLPAKQLNELMTLVSVKTGKPLKTPDEKDPNGFGLGIGVSYPGKEVPGLVVNYEGQTFGYRAQYFYFLNQNLLITGIVNSSVDASNDHLGKLLMNAYKVWKISK